MWNSTLLFASLFHSICQFVSVPSFPSIHPFISFAFYFRLVCLSVPFLLCLYVSILFFMLSVYLFMMDAPWQTGLTWLRLDVVIFLFLPLSVIYDVFYLGPACLFGRISYRQSMSFRLSYVLLLADLLFCTNSRFSFYPVSLVALVQLFLIPWI